MSFEGVQLQGAPKIMEKLSVSTWGTIRLTILLTNFIFVQSLSFQKISRVITAVDSQPMFDGGVLINVLGRLKVKYKYNKN